MLQADAAGRAKGEKKREKTSTSSKENFEQNNNGGSGTKREKKRVSPSNVNQRLLSGSCSRAVLLSVEREQSRGGKSLEKDTDDRETCCLHPHHALF